MKEAPRPFYGVFPLMDSGKEWPLAADGGCLAGSNWRRCTFSKHPKWHAGRLRNSHDPLHGNGATKNACQNITIPMEGDFKDF